MGYWKFIEGPQSALPVIPQLKWTQKIRGPDETGTAHTIVITSNEVEVQKAMDDAVPWHEGDIEALNAIIQAMPLLGQHLNPLAGFHVWALQEDAAGAGSNQRLMGEVKNRMVG
jgi:hypothetical protein